MDDFEHECRRRRDGVIQVRIGVDAVADPRFTKGPARASLPPDLRGSETLKLFGEAARLLYRGRPAKALPKLRRAEAMARMKYGQKSSVVAWIQNHVGVAYKELNRFTEAEASFREALGTREATLNASDPLIAVSLNNLGDTLYQQGRAQEGVPLLVKAVEIESQAYGPDSRDTMLTRVNLVDVLIGAGRGTEAIDELKKLRIGLNRHGDNLFGFGSIPERVQELAKRLEI